MWRYGAGAISGLLLAVAGFLLWTGMASRDPHVPAPPRGFAALGGTAAAAVPTPDAPQATEKTREEKRFDRYDRNRNGAIERDEYLYARHRNFAKLDTNGDGVLSFDEYAAKAEAKFATADADKSGTLDRKEFATTRVVRKSRPPRCPPATARQADVASEDGDAG